MAARVQEIAQASKGFFSVDEITKSVVKSLPDSPLPTSKEEWEAWRKRVSNILRRMAKKNLLEQVKGKKGTYCRVGYKPEQVPAQPMKDETETASLRILRTIPKPLAIRLPLGLEKYVLTYPGDLIVVAGATNAGKTAFFLNLVWLNWGLLPIRYLTSELSEVRLSKRLHDFCEVHGTSLDDWDQKVVFGSRDSRFAPAMDPAGLNVIDYLEIYEKFPEVGLPIKEIFKRQQGHPGVTFVGLQMKHGNFFGRGGSLTMEKPFLYLTIDNFKKRNLNRLVIEKAKDPASETINPNGMDFWFRIEKGCRFVSVEKPKDAAQLVTQARKEANGGQ